MSTIVAPATLEEIRDVARPYPDHLLPEHGSALSLFAAGFHGWNDCIHFVGKEMDVDCVDTDSEKLDEMAAVYPSDWRFHRHDAWEFAAGAVRLDRQWDVVSVDPFMGDAAEHAWQTLYLWTEIARHLVTLTVATDTHLNAPEGWTTSFFPRADSVAWMVLSHA